jgi:hypothetical protein
VDVQRASRWYAYHRSRWLHFRHSATPKADQIAFEPPGEMLAVLDCPEAIAVEPTGHVTKCRLNRPGMSGDSDVPRVRRCRYTWFQATGWADLV